jgi:hypothetical protein
MTDVECKQDSDCSTNIPGASSKCFVDVRSITPLQMRDLRVAAPPPNDPSIPVDFAAINSFLATLTGVKGACHINKRRMERKEGGSCPAGYRESMWNSDLCDLIMD